MVHQGYQHLSLITEVFLYFLIYIILYIYCLSFSQRLTSIYNNFCLHDKRTKQVLLKSPFKKGKQIKYFLRIYLAKLLVAFGQFRCWLRVSIHAWENLPLSAHRVFFSPLIHLPKMNSFWFPTTAPFTKPCASTEHDTTTAHKATYGSIKKKKRWIF